MSIGSRIKELRKAMQLTQVEFSHNLRISKGFLSNLEKDVRIPSNQLVRLIAYEYSSSEDWIMNGEGEMFLTPKEIINSQIDRLGTEKYLEVLNEILNEHSLVVPIGSLTLHSNGKTHDPELAHIMSFLETLWSLEDEKLKAWAKVQFERAFPQDMQEEIQKKSTEKQDQISS